MEPFGQIYPAACLFWSCDPLLRGWEVEADALAIVNFVCNSGKPDQWTHSRDLAPGLNWPINRINPTLRYLADHDLVEPSKAFGSHPYTFDGFFLKPRARRWAASSTTP